MGILTKVLNWVYGIPASDTKPTFKPEVATNKAPTAKKPTAKKAPAKKTTTKKKTATKSKK